MLCCVVPFCSGIGNLTYDWMIVLKVPGSAYLKRFFPFFKRSFQLKFHSWLDDYGYQIAPSLPGCLRYVVDVMFGICVGS